MNRLFRAVVLGCACAAGIAAGEGDRKHLKLATTTSVDDSGLLPALLPAFERKTGMKVDVLAVGTGKAIKLAENGDVDMILVHDPDMEKAFVKSGFGVRRSLVMYNDFVIVGPPADLASVGRAKTAYDAMRRVAGAKTPFVSRGDMSGTHAREKALWTAAGVAPSGSWYIEAGQGMGPVLIMAGEKEAYALTDRGTFLAMKDKLPLTIAFENPKQLKNEYHAIAVNPARYKDVRFAEAKELIHWLVSAEAQRLIGDYAKGGVTLFHPVK